MKSPNIMNRLALGLAGTGIVVAVVYVLMSVVLTITLQENTLQLIQALNQRGYIAFQAIASGDWIIDGDIAFTEDSTYDIGTTSTRPANVYTDNLDSAGGVTIATNIRAATAATAVVCGSGSRTTLRCDWVADGTADNLEINAALAALPAGGGCVVLLEGTYTLAATVAPPSNGCLSGQGYGTLLKPATSTNIYVVTVDQVDNVTVRMLRIKGDKSGAPSRDGITVNNPSNDLTLQNLWIHETGDDCLDAGNQPTGETGYINYRMVVRDLRLWDCGGAQISANTVYNSVFDSIFSRDTAGDGSLTGDGFLFDCVRDTSLNNMYVSGVGGNGYRFFANTDPLGGACEAMRIKGNNLTAAAVGWDGAGRNAFRFEDIDIFEGTNLIATGCRNTCFQITTGSTTVGKNISLKGWEATGGVSIGAQINGTSGNTLALGRAVDNGAQGISITGAGAINNVVTGNKSYDTRSGGSRTQTHGLQEASSADLNTITDNQFYNNATANLVWVGGNTIRLSTYTNQRWLQNVAGASSTAVHAIQDCTGAEQTITAAITNPAIPRNIRVTHTNNNAGASAGVVVRIIGTDVFDRAQTEDITITVGGNADGVKAFKTVTSYIVGPDPGPYCVAGGSPDRISVGIGRLLSLGDTLVAASDWIGMERAATTAAFIPEPTANYSTTNIAVYMAVSLNAITANDSFRFVFRTPRNRILDVVAP